MKNKEEKPKETKKVKMTMDDLVRITSQSFTEMRTEFNGNFEKIDRRFDVLEGRFDHLESRFDTLESRFDKLEYRHNARLERLEDDSLLMKKRLQIA